MVVVGDCNVDITCTLPGALAFEDLSEEPLLYIPVEVAPGGSLVNLSLAATAHFSWVGAVGRVGADAFGDLVGERLRVSGVNAHLSRDRERGTGVVIGIREGSRGAGYRAHRSLLVEERSAGKHVDVQDIREIETWLGRTGHLFIDGYLLVGRESRAACVSAMGLAAAAGALVSVDLVPHRLWREVTLDEVAPLVTHASVLIAEVGTVLRLCGAGPIGRGMEYPDALHAAEVVSRLLPGKGLILRFGAYDITQSLTVVPGREPRLEATGYEPVGPVVGFGDALTARQLAEWPGTQRGAS